jgi:hypothetical protein
VAYSFVPNFPVLIEYFIMLFRDTAVYPILSECAILATKEAFFMLKVSPYRFCLTDGFCALLY